MSRTFKHLETNVVRGGEPETRIEGAVVTPIFQSAMFEYAGETSYHDLKYIRLNNTPTHVVLHAKLAAMEGGEAALVSASGMAAISTTLLTVLRPGDHLLAQDCLYGGTHDLLVGELAALGIETTFVDPDDPSAWERLVTPRTRAIYVETLTNPLLQVADLEAVVRFARAHELVSLIDNTFASSAGVNTSFRIAPGSASSIRRPSFSRYQMSTRSRSSPLERTDGVSLFARISSGLSTAIPSMTAFEAI